MSMNKNLMVTLTGSEIEQLEKLSNWLGCSKSRVISQALNLLQTELNSNKTIGKSIENYKTIVKNQQGEG